MSALKENSQVQDIIEEIDRLISEMSSLRSRVAALESSPSPPKDTVRNAEYFGMWADRDDMKGLSSREWLERLRAQQWTRE